MKQCAIYTRVSTTMQAEVEYNSCEAQRDKILSFIKSQEDLEVYREYSDPGYSGADIDRPALKDLLRDIEGGQIQAVLTYKIDRLTRSAKDFYSLIDLFEKHGVSFISVTECFDTSSPSGRLLRNIMLTFAQFEREMTAERIKDKLQQRAEKGMWHGGCVPFGYKGVNKKLVVDMRSATVVRQIFEHFVLTGSAFETAKMIRESNIASSYSKVPLSQSRIYHLLSNSIYVGKIKRYDKIYEGLHEPLISLDLFEHAQGLLNKKAVKRGLTPYREYPLAGLIKCSECGSGMAPYHAKKPGKRYFYYKCYKVLRHGPDACSIKAVGAENLESFIFQQLARISQDGQYIENLAFKLAYEMPGLTGLELRDSVVRTLSEIIKKALEKFKGGMESKSSAEKNLIVRNAIQTIRFFRCKLELVVTLRATILHTEPSQSGKMAARIRGAEVNPTPRAYNSEFERTRLWWI
jgi:DNA invertase Pin-like site-specific DNA recombinase